MRTMLRKNNNLLFLKLRRFGFDKTDILNNIFATCPLSLKIKLHDLITAQHLSFAET